MGRARTCDPTAGFSVDQVLAGFFRLYTIEDAQLVPALDAHHKLPVCPITLAPFEDPVLLEDGFVYEQAAIVQWLERHPNAPCTNIEVRNLRVLRLEPFRAFVSKLLEKKRDCMHNGWRTQLLKAEQEANCYSTEVFIRCGRVEHAIDSCMAEAAELEAGLKVARCTASRLRAELRRRQLNSVKLQRAVRCWLVRRRLRNARALLKLVRSTMQVQIARQLLDRLRVARSLAVLRIQRWWKRHLKRMAKRAKRQRARQLKRERSKALREEANGAQPSSNPPGQDSPRIYYWNPATDETSWHPPTGARSGEPFVPLEVNSSVNAFRVESVPQWDYFRTTAGDLYCFNCESQEVLFGQFVGIPTAGDRSPPIWTIDFNDEGMVYWWNRETLETTMIPPTWGIQTAADRGPITQGIQAHSIALMSRAFPEYKFRHFHVPFAD